MRWTRLALTIAVLAACGDPPPAPPQAPAKAAAPVEPVRPQEPAPRRTPAVPPLPWPPPPDRPPPVDVPFLHEPEVTAAAAGFVWVEAPPFLVLAEYQQQDVRDTKRVYDEKAGQNFEVPIDGTTNPAKVMQNLEWRRKAPPLAERTARLLTSLHARFRDVLAEPLKLAEIPAERRLVVVVARRKPLWDEWQRRGPTLGWVAEFRPETGVTCAYFNDTAAMREDEVPCAGGRVQKVFDQDLCAAAAAQLLQEYAATVRYDVTNTNRLIGPGWFALGLSQFLGGVECDAASVETLEGAALSHGRILLDRIQPIRAMNAFDARPWNVASILAARDADIAERIAQRAFDRDHPRRPGDSLAVFGARAWAFAHYSWFAHDGKRRGAFLDVARHVLDGTEKPETAAACYGLASDADFAAIDADFDVYWRAILERQVGRDKVTKQWFEPSTDPPTLK